MSVELERDATGTARGAGSERVLERILDRLERIEGTLARLEQVGAQAPALAAIATDVFDEGCRRAGERGVDIDARLGRVLQLTEKLTEPGTLDALETLLARLPQLSELAGQLDAMPGLLAVVGDVFDEWAAGLSRQGIDLHHAVQQGLHAALWLGQRVSETELERLGFLLQSDVLDPHVLAVVAKSGRALATCHEGTCATSAPERLGPLGLMRSLTDPNVQRSLAFLVQVARCFGGHLPEPTEIKARPVEPRLCP